MSTVREKYRELSAAIAETDTFVTWKPEKVGDLIVGEVVEFDTALQTKNGIKTIIRIRSDWCITGGVERANDIYTVWASQTQLKKKIDALPHTPFKGDEMQIKFCSILPVKGGNTMKEFWVRHNPRGPAKDVKVDAKVDDDEPFAKELADVGIKPIKPTPQNAEKEFDVEPGGDYLSDEKLPLMEEMGGVK